MTSGRETADLSGVSAFFLFRVLHPIFMWDLFVPVGPLQCVALRVTLVAE